MIHRLLLPLLFATACRDLLDPVETGRDTDPIDVDTTEADSDTDDVDSDTVGLPGEGNQEWARGDIAWELDFDATAEAQGYMDCTYIRHYEAGEDVQRDFLCPECDMIYLADVRFTAGLETCYRQLNGTNPIPDELLGRGSGAWYRGRSYSTPLTSMGSATVSGPTWEVSGSGTIEAGSGSATYSISGTLDRSLREGDTSHGLVPPETYACGWSGSGRPAYEGNFDLVEGRDVPDVVLYDACDEPARLYDLFDGYLVLYSSAPDCLTCRDMASEQRAFQTEVDSLGWNVDIVSLVVPSLSNTTGQTSLPQLNQYVVSMGLSGEPVLRDRGFTWSVLGSGFPTTVLVAPDGEVFKVSTGYADGKWDFFGCMIDQHIHGCEVNGDCTSCNRR